MLDAVAFLQLLDDRFFGNGLTRRHTRKLGLDGRTIDDEEADRLWKYDRRSGTVHQKIGYCKI